MSPVSPDKHLSKPTPSSSLPDPTPYEPSLAIQNTPAAASRKRKRRDKHLVGFGSQQDLPLYSIAAKISNAILSGGRKYEPSIFETWERDLWLLNPDRAKLTLTGLLTQQRTYTEALLSQGIVARIIHSWCLIAYEHSLSTVDRSKSVRRNQKEIRLSLRCRKLGILFLEIINELFAQGNIGINAYKVCPAIAVSVEDPFPIPHGYRDLSVSRLQTIARYVVRDLVADPNKAWANINLEHALDPAAQIATKDFTYDKAKRALGLKAAALSPTANLTTLRTHARRQSSDEQPNREICEETVPVADLTSTYGPATTDDGLKRNIDTIDSLTLARDEQAFRFINSMDTNVWQWNEFLDLSPIIDRSPPGNGS
ncbi:hypothetical protein MBLNU13_g07965t2 [Cladosporium sp. NU13]